MKEGKWVICSGGSLGAWAHPYLREADRRVGADRGRSTSWSRAMIPIWRWAILIR
ncbi:hypothetical protein LJK88_02600 [Paenibacillus sp. P26]|nr:hypothetical protein LJK88_02600 [Paenibacillus sp. P26]